MEIQTKSRQAVFLDRDGVLNRVEVSHGLPRSPVCVEDVEILPGVPEALKCLRDAGFLLIVVTNRPDVARGIVSLEAVTRLHREMQRTLGLDDVCICPHDDAAHCTCRKPAPGLLLSAAAKWGLDLPACYMVGDRWRDIEAGRQAGCTTILVDYGYADALRSEPDRRVASMCDAAAWILSRARQT